MGKEPVMPKTLLLKMVEVPLRIAMQVMVMFRLLQVSILFASTTSSAAFWEWGAAS